MLGGSFHQCLMQSSGFLHFLGWYRLYRRRATLGPPRIFLHQKYIYQRIEVRPRSQRILHRHHFRAVDFPQLLHQHVVVTFLIIQLVHQENNRFAQLFSVAEMILRTYLHAILAIEQQDGRIGHVQCRNGSSHKVVAARAVYNVQLLPVPLHMENGGKHRIAIFLLHREVIADCVLGSNSATTFYNPTLIEQRLRESGFSRAIIAKQSNVFDFIRLIYFHDMSVFKSE